jgi:hypothetical protein
MLPPLVGLHVDTQRDRQHSWWYALRVLGPCLYFLLLRYATFVQLKAEGDGGMPEFIAQLPSDDIVWGALKVVAVDDRGNLVSRRPKYVCVKVGPT